MNFAELRSASLMCSKIVFLLFQLNWSVIIFERCREAKFLLAVTDYKLSQENQSDHFQISRQSHTFDKDEGKG